MISEIQHISLRLKDGFVINRKHNCVSPGIIFSAEIRPLKHLATGEIGSSTF